MLNFISYDDNLFFIISEVKNLKNSLKLTLDSSLFSDFYIQHLRSLSQALCLVQKKLLEHPKLVRFNEHLQLLRSTESALIELLDKCLSHNLMTHAKKTSEISSLRNSLHTMYDITLKHLADNKKITTKTDTVSNQEIIDLLYNPSHKEGENPS